MIPNPNKPVRGDTLGGGRPVDQNQAALAALPSGGGQAQAMGGKPVPGDTLGGGRQVDQSLPMTMEPPMSGGTPPMSTGNPPMSTGYPAQSQQPPMSGGTPMSPNQPNYAPQQVNPNGQLPQFQQYADAAYQDATRRLDPQFQQMDDRFRQQMVNQGLSEGTEAYDKARKNFDMGKNDAYSQAQNQSLLAGLGAQNQAWGQQFAQAQEGNRQGQFGDQFAFQGQRADMQDLMALLGFGQQTNSQNNAMLDQDFNRTGGLFGLVPGMTPVQVDVMSPYQMQNDRNIAAMNAQQSGSNGMMGALGQIGAAAAPLMMMSDRRVKTDISPVGKLDNGLTVYAFRYKAGGPLQLGLIAQEVQETHPEAVGDFDGILAVDYAKAVL